MKRLLLATFFLVPLTECSFLHASTAFQAKENFIDLECSRPASNEWKEWTVKLEIDVKNNTVDFYTQSNNFSDAERYSSEFVTITNRYIKFDKPEYEKNTVNRRTGSYISVFQTGDPDSSLMTKYSCKKIRSRNLF